MCLFGNTAKFLINLRCFVSFWSSGLFRQDILDTRQLPDQLYHRGDKGEMGNEYCRLGRWSSPLSHSRLVLDTLGLRPGAHTSLLATVLYIVLTRAQGTSPPWPLAPGRLHKYILSSRGPKVCMSLQFLVVWSIMMLICRQAR